VRIFRQALSRNDAVESWERTRPACCRRRRAVGFVPPFATPFGEANGSSKHLRRDAANHTPEACAPIPTAWIRLSFGTTRKANSPRIIMAGGSIHPFVIRQGLQGGRQGESASAILRTIAVSINIGANANPVGLTCWSANPAAQQRRPTTRCANVVVIFYNTRPQFVSRRIRADNSE
jgi:hypothetical protein